MDNKRPRLVGSYIRTRRESLGLSQRALGLLFVPPVTTQFISNVERGVTPLPPAHVATLAKALSVADAEIMNLLEKEYSAKLNERLGRPEMHGSAPGDGLEMMIQTPGLTISPADMALMQTLYNAYRQADPKTRQTFADVCQNMLKVDMAALLTR
jgi:transcriptional regulator with XRE-family HTH domain